MKKFFIILFLIIFAFISNPVFAEEIASTTETYLENEEENSGVEAEIPLEPEMSPVRIKLDIESVNGTIYKSEVLVTACLAEDGGILSVSAYCALQQIGVPVVWNTFGTDSFLHSINGVENDFGSNLYWLWFSNLELGSVAMNKHLLVEGEEVLVSIGKMPMKIRVSTTTPYVGATTTIETLQFAFDSSFTPVYENALDAKIVINGEELETQNGIFEFVPVSTSSLNIFGRKDGYLDSKEILLNPILSESTSTEEHENNKKEDSNNTISTSIQSGGGQSPRAQFDVSKAISFLMSKQKENGTFGDDLYTDWATIALASSEGKVNETLKEYLRTQSYTGSSVTDFERRAIALMASGINPYNGTSINYIEKIFSSFDGEQVGDKILINDDVFAIFPLVKAGYGTSEDVMQKILAFILSKQREDGSWEGSVDMTGATLQAISLFSRTAEIENAITKGKEFLRSAQREDGGFGDAFSTSWAVQGIVATNDSPKNWFKGGKNYLDYFGSMQATDGAVLGLNEHEPSRIWATSYAIPASYEKTWSSLLNSYEKPASLLNYAESNSGSFSFPSNASSIENFDNATSTLVLDDGNVLVDSIATSSSATSTQEIIDANNIEVFSENSEIIEDVVESSISKEKEIDTPTSSLSGDYQPLVANVQSSKGINANVLLGLGGVMGVILGLIFRRFVLPI